MGKLAWRWLDHMQLAGAAKYEPTVILARKSSAAPCANAASVGGKTAHGLCGTSMGTAARRKTAASC
eukprot:1026744-Lingulodinium_polyedra.AAC.1